MRALILFVALSAACGSRSEDVPTEDVAARAERQCEHHRAMAEGLLKGRAANARGIKGKLDTIARNIHRHLKHTASNPDPKLEALEDDVYELISRAERLALEHELCIGRIRIGTKEELTESCGRADSSRAALRKAYQELADKLSASTLASELRDRIAEARESLDHQAASEPTAKLLAPLAAWCWSS